MQNRAGRYLLSLFVLSSVLTFAAYKYLSRWGRQAVNVEKASLFYFPSGTKLSELAGALEAQNLVDNSLYFKIWVKLFGNYRAYQAGRYQFTGRISPELIDAKLTSGKTHNPVILKFVIPEGFTLKQVIERVVARGIGTYSELWDLAHDPNFLGELEVQSKNLEGFIYPATYSFTKRPTGKEVLRRMVKTFWAHLPTGYVEKVRERGLSLHEAVTFASLIERETTHIDEMDKVSEVIWNRLKSREALAIDASLIYGIEDYDGDIKWSHLKDKSNPYNTRVHRGLPPGPIGAVSRKCLEAVLTPTSFGYRYYVLKAGTTRHHFSKTLKEHNKYVRLLLKKQK